MKEHLLGLLGGLLLGIVGVGLFYHFSSKPVQVQVQQMLGQGAHSQAAQQLGASSVTSNAVTTTCFTNSGSTTVVLDKLIWFSSSTQSAIAATTSVNFAISTDTVNVQTALSSGATAAAGSMGTILTSTPNFFTSSTFSTVTQRLLPVGSSVIAYRGASIDTTTQAFCGAWYYQP